MKVYVLRLTQRPPTKVAILLGKAFADKDIEAEVIRPVINRIRRRNGKPVMVAQDKFPGYLFLRTDDLSGVEQLLCPEYRVGVPIGARLLSQMPLRDYEMAEILTEVTEKPDEITVGDLIQVISGSFEGMRGEVIACYTNHAKVWVEIFGRTVDIELPLSDIVGIIS